MSLFVFFTPLYLTVRIILSRLMNKVREETLGGRIKSAYREDSDQKVQYDLKGYNVCHICSLSLYVQPVVLFFNNTDQ